ncbi:UDP-2,4-diacetamido-2,4,6-trideoxy-beta-L-altropyranose hydrolase, partial [bacterium]|nr:UDP-2,4-diacetamido-2,4,6-trideoxy-beta-L-altropyranose hydrolase [bacterium]
SDVAIGAGGTTAWERCCLGLPTLVTAIADNQEMIVNTLHENGAAIKVILEKGRSNAEFLSNFNFLCSDVEQRLKMSRKASELVDGAGARRVVELVLEDY